MTTIERSSSFAIAAAFAAAVSIPSQASGQIAEIAKAQAADPLAPYVKASGWVATGKGAVFVELLIDNSNAAIRLRTATNADPRLEVLSSPSDVLQILADRRMQFLWEPLADWTGPTLEKMRDRRLAHLRAAYAAGNAELPATSSSETPVRPKIRALIQLADFLIAVGQTQEAERLLQEQLTTMKPRTDGSWNAIEWFSIAAWIATARWAAGDSAGAISEYEMIERTLGNSPYEANATISKASFLAESGHYAEALSAIDALYAQWRKDNRGYKINGSERQFAWIRACALEGLGRRAEAEAAFQPVVQATNTHDPYYVIETDDTLQVKGRACMNQPDAVAAIVADELENQLPTEALLLFQPAYHPRSNVELRARVRSDPKLMGLARQRMRILPPEMTAALNGWR